MQDALAVTQRQVCAVARVKRVDKGAKAGQ
jgi:hypothetical protein